MSQLWWRSQSGSGLWCCIVVVALLACWGVRGQEEMCSSPPISYEVVTRSYSATIIADLACTISNPQWWTSTNPCGPFQRSVLCPENSSSCNFSITTIENHFYHCCTTSGRRVVDSLDELSGNCFRVEICATIDQDSSTNPSALAFFGRTLLLYVYVFSAPQPQQTHQIILGSKELENSSKVSVFRLSAAEPRFTFEYSISIPFAGDDTQEGGTSLFFSTVFQGICRGNPNVVYRIPVISRGGGQSTESTTAPTLLTSTALSSPTTGGVSNEGCSNRGLIASVGTLAVSCVAAILILVVLLLLLWNSRQKHKKALRAALSSTSGRPNSLSMHNQYLRLQSSDQTPSPAVQFQQYPPGQPPPLPAPSRHNGTHSNNNNNAPPPHHMPVTTPSTAPPVPPSTLSISHQHQSHSGQTPLISLTPANTSPSQPFPHGAGGVVTTPPSYNQAVVMSSPVVNSAPPPSSSESAEYATIGDGSVVSAAPRQQRGTSPGGGGGGGDVGVTGDNSTAPHIYSNRTITTLANSVELPGAELSTQTVV